MKSLKFWMAIATLPFISLSARAQFLKAEIQVSGLTCSMCQLATQKALKTIPFISDIKPDLNKNIYVVTFKKDQPVELDQIKSKIKGAGFSVSDLAVVFNFENQKIENNYHFKYGGNIYHFMNVPARTLDGQVKLSLLDKDFVPSAEFKKIAAQTTYPCYKSGYMGKERVYHVTI
ncbi:hypothetical protein GS399_01360 [Pedobacter sp. HMF7647]|uniref:HMA domain-containing protein n=1 Tax=Hufsiella arboris TaxID=2695275 RepID=A0A7K1Y4U7_9SPHI|nr:heavy metal-associated domain-containing protein [Hufsiella arboris]MXV49605.1 hypothetical protein [Hufsiella arboris]